MRLARTREWREASGYTQATLAAAAGMNKMTITRIERGEETSPETARKLATAMDITVADLLERPPVPLGEAAPRPRVLERMLDAARADDEKDRKAVNRAHASQGTGRLPSASAYEEDRLRAELRQKYDVGDEAFDELFDALIWPLAREAQRNARANAELQEELEKAKAEVKDSKKPGDAPNGPKSLA